ncbi:MAG: hypothetical protein AAGG11_20605 [Pseudomonadota bacterium]
MIAEPHRRNLASLSRSVGRSFELPSPRHGPAAYQQALLDVIDQEAVDLVVPISEEALHVIPLLAEHRPAVPCFGPNPATLLQLHDKGGFIDLVRDIGWPAPETHRADTDAAAALVRAQPTVLKARASCAGDGLQFLEPGAPIPAAKQTPQWVLQHHVAGALTCSFALVIDGVVQRTIVYRAEVLSGTVAVCFRRLQENEAAYADFTRRIAAATGFSGFLAFDFIDDGVHAPWPIECNPRVTSGIHFLDATACARLLLRNTGLATAAGEAEVRDIGLSPHLLQQQFYPCLTETQRVMFSDGAAFRHRLRLLRKAKDVTFRWRDPLPFLLMPYAAWRIMSKALFGGMTFGAAATVDIEWDGIIDS